jgi:hypothetical protein
MPLGRMLIVYLLISLDMLGNTDSVLFFLIHATFYHMRFKLRYAPPPPIAPNLKQVLITL